MPATKNPRRLTVANLPRTSPTEFLECKVYYDEGGICYATYNRKERGYYASVTPVTVKDGMLSFTMFSGSAIFLQPADRFNAKQLAHWAERIMEFEPFKKLLEGFQEKANA